MPAIRKKKTVYPVSDVLHGYLVKYGRQKPVPIHYPDLLRFDNAIPLYDSDGEDTLWKTVFYPQQDMEGIYEALTRIYAILKADGDTGVMQHLYIDRVDLCDYGNTHPFRVRIVNKINDNFDYFYVKRADASRSYGLELEDLLSPNRVSFLVHEHTLIEEHIAGVPGDQFIIHYLQDRKLNKIRIGKEFVKFNERCFVRLLGDMHSNNFVIEITPDFEEVNYRIRAIDFDQQSFEGQRSVYMPQYYKQNNPIIQMGIDAMTHETLRQYQKEERALIAHRIRSSEGRVQAVLKTMKKDKIAPEENVLMLRQQLAEHYHDPSFHACKNMGDILERSLQRVLEER